MLFRFREQQAAEMGIIDRSRERRPRDIRSVKTVADCERWRGQVLREISKKITRIHEPALSESLIRDLNDEINKLMREKHVWELQLRDLGGPNYIRFGGSSNNVGSDKDVMTSTRGYKYFGRARDLPGVKELFEAQAKQRSAASHETKKEPALPQNLPASYYALEDEDADMLSQEQVAEQDLDTHTADPWGPSQLPYSATADFSFEPLPELHHLPTPSEVEKYLVERRRQKLEQLYIG
ncbi:Isy1p [Sugiyamaella lignohabitans]|uniref:Pre-mRNA-splicing factor ISY1 n=1 Tax=Sugiyamaella lignohabitans TaxID=796027 RepID=A0A167CBE5_9ASCO|nr:Isy1p [Sugiyamaella lignohabitans]ANB11464.1 Isy1p [Sugiyamaella lignohabitans]